MELFDTPAVFGMTHLGLPINSTLWIIWDLALLYRSCKSKSGAIRLTPHRRRGTSVYRII